MTETPDVKLTLPDKIIGYFNPSYRARAVMDRYVASRPARVLRRLDSQEQHREALDWAMGYKRYSPQNSARRAADVTRTDTGYERQPWGSSGTRTNTATARKSMVRRARNIDENNILGSSMLDRAVSNIVGEGLTLQAKTEDDEWNRAAEELWKNYTPDARGLMDMGETQRAWCRAKFRDGDFGGLLLKSGLVQGIEGDYIQSPAGAYEKNYNPNIIDGVEVDAVGRPTAFHLSVLDSKGNAVSQRILARDMLWYANTCGRFNREAVRGVSVLAMLGPALDQIDGTNEAVVIAHRMSASFGVIHQRKNPASAFGSLPQTATNADGDSVRERAIEPGMYEYADVDDKFTQIKAEHPTTSFADFMTFQIRLAGIKMGLPLELALLDFSKTNYSSARASMEQAYRQFRIEQRQLSNLLARLYRWRVSKWMKDKELPQRDDAFKHRWLGQPWPYLDPEKEASASLVAIDGGLTLLGDELAKRGIDFEDWIEAKTEEIRRLESAGIKTSKSGSTRDEVEATPDAGGTNNEDQTQE